MEIVTVVNRTNQPVEWMYDGRVCGPIPALGERPFELEAAVHGKRKTRYGFDADNGTWHYRVGIKEHGDDCSPIATNSAESPEQWVDLLHRKDNLVDLEGRPLQVKQVSNPDLAMSRPVDGGDF